ncbi:MAG: ABC transporter permease [Armatimonadetes bacterium]|nr:ABC transporter permease [Armatimonadota bacterium]
MLAPPPAGPLLRGLESLGEVALLCFRTGRALLTRPLPAAETIRQMHNLGVASLPLVLLTILFSGMVLSLHTAGAFKDIGGQAFVGLMVAVSMARELAPVLTAVVVSARVGSAIAAELGTMVVTEQVDALRALGVNPIHQLVVPRVLAGLVMLPVLTVFANLVGVLGAWAVAVFGAGIGSRMFWDAAQRLPFDDLLLGLVKTVVFGAIVTVIGCYHGLRTTGGAAGVGRATTAAVVTAIVLIYISDYFLAELMFSHKRVF